MNKYKHLKRLSEIFIRCPVFYITSCTIERQPFLACDAYANILIDEWNNSLSRYGWLIGHYVIMPDHVHFFCSPTDSAKKISLFVGKWKEWTCKRITEKINDTIFKNDDDINHLWQEEFFDHVLRSEESYYQKCLYIYNNPVRAGLVDNPEEWKYSGHIHFPA